MTTQINFVLLSGLCPFAPLRANNIVGATLIALTFIGSLRASETASKAEPLEVKSVVLRLIAEADVPAQEAGILTAIPAREGQRVKQGELLAQIDDQVAQMAERAAALELEVARAKATNDVQIRFAHKAAEVAEAELRRSTESIERFAKSVSQSQLDVERLTVEKTRLETEQANQNMQLAALEMKSKENELAAMKVALARRRIESPIDGIVVQVFVRLGEWAEPGQKALRIVNADRLKAEGFLPADAATRVAVGAPVRLTLDLTDQQPASFEGVIAFVSPEVDPITGQVRVWAEINNRDGRLRPGQSVRMALEDGKSVARSTDGRR